VAYGNNVGGALNDGVSNLFAGHGSGKEIVDAMTTAASQ
jgi:raffinose/stachyose/melibiose transport system substrate-binding protein